MDEPKTFEELNISADLKRALKELNLTSLFPIQAQAIPLMLDGKDIIGQAQTGTGKTAAFAIPIIEKIDASLGAPQAMVLVPTRELAVQVCDEIKKLSRYKRINTLAVYGGASIERQIEAMERGVHVIVGTPGRIIDHLKRGTLRLSRIKMFILDEADRMLDMGFIDDIKFVLELIPQDKQTALFSATMPEPIVYLAKDYMRDYQMISVSKDEITVEEIEQVYVEVDYYNKIDTLKKIIQVEQIESAIIFCNTKLGVDKLQSILQKMRYHAEAIHGNLSQGRRNKVMADFKAGRIQFMIATDVAARGLDIKGVSHIINYNAPKDPKDYVHRIGRTGRAGKTGKAITFISDQDAEALGSIEWYINMKIKKVDYGVPKSKQQGPRSHGGQQGGYGGQRGGYGQRSGYGERGGNQEARRERNKYALGEF
ncbi:MAG: DEAD/DEAH box helicase [Candidatus Nanoarchaeia archaeon]|nr:DEAD/DEAH box helicase [Candidatus Nanoarchaeia archaeon]MDD5239034.1 DEAD/DEAH box helicase [Candidatus Nanoarchaeia archaeon]